MQHKVLYIEDNDDNVYMLRRRLERRGYDVAIATTGHDGIDQALSGRPDLVIVDLVLPDINGCEVASTLKSAPQTAPLPIIALSANVTIEDRDHALQSGCDAFEPKPIDFARLLGKMQALLP